MRTSTHLKKNLQQMGIWNWINAIRDEWRRTVFKNQGLLLLVTLMRRIIILI